MHSTAEAEAVCDRVAVMVSRRLRWVPAKPTLGVPPHRGRCVEPGWPAALVPGPRVPSGGSPSLPLPAHLPLAARCIGSIQHLKSRFGRDYLLEVKLRSLAQLESLHREVLRIFPQAARQDRSPLAHSVSSWSLLCSSVMARYDSCIFSFMSVFFKTIWES